MSPNTCAGTEQEFRAGNENAYEETENSSHCPLRNSSHCPLQEYTAAGQEPFQRSSSYPNVHTAFYCRPVRCCSPCAVLHHDPRHTRETHVAHSFACREGHRDRQTHSREGGPVLERLLGRALHEDGPSRLSVDKASNRDQGDADDGSDRLPHQTRTDAPGAPVRTAQWGSALHAHNHTARPGRHATSQPAPPLRCLATAPAGEAPGHRASGGTCRPSSCTAYGSARCRSERTLLLAARPAQRPGPTA